MGTPRDEGPLVGDGGSADETGWEGPTRPDRPTPPPKAGAGGQPEPASPEHDDDLDEKER